MPDMGNPEYRQRTYDAHAKLLADMAAKRAAHLADQCNAVPLCAGPPVMENLVEMRLIDRRAYDLLVLTAIGEIDELTQSRDSARLALAAEKARTADLRERLKMWEDSAC